MTRPISAHAALLALARRGKVTLLTAAEQFRARLLFAAGLCRAGRHPHRDRSARAMCCNGWRRCWSYVAIDGKLTPVASWRPVTLADPRFRWEPAPSVIPFHVPLGDDYYTPVEVLGVEPDRDYSTEQRLERLRLNLSFADAHLAAGSRYSL